MKQSILFVIGSLNVGGAERHLVSLLPALAVRQFRPLVYTLTEKGAMASRLEAAGIQVLEPPFFETVRRLPTWVSTLTLLPLTVLSLWWVMVRRRPDIVHCFLPAAYVIGMICGLLTGVRIRVMSRRSLNVYQRTHPFIKRLERLLHRGVTAALGNSQAVKMELLDEGLCSQKVGVIYSGIELSRMGNVPPRDVLRDGLTLEQVALVLTVVANLIPYKGHMDLLNALHVIQGELPPGWVLLCVGKDCGIGPQLVDYSLRLNVHKNVRWLGERSDVNGILHASDIGILCSHQEGFSNSVLEGMAAGLPMVVTSVGGNVEAVSDGVTGLVVPPHDPVSLGRAILSLAKDSRRRKSMGKAGREEVAMKFSFATCLARYERLYSLLGKNENHTVSSILDGVT